MSALAANSSSWDALERTLDVVLKFEETALQYIGFGLSAPFFTLFANRRQHDPVVVRSSPLLWAKLVSVFFWLDAAYIVSAF